MTTISLMIERIDYNQLFTPKILLSFYEKKSLWKGDVQCDCGGYMMMMKMMMMMMMIPLPFPSQSMLGC